MKIAIYDPYLDALGGGEKYMMTAAEALSQHHEVTILWDHENDIEKVEDRFGLDLSKTKISHNIFSSQVSAFQRLQKTKDYDVLLYLSDGSIPVVRCKLVIHFQFPIEWITVNWKTKFKLRRVSTIITNSLFTKKFVDRKLRVNSTVVYPPVSLKHTDTPKENIILHVGRFMKTGVEGSDYKKQYFMIDVFKELVDQGLKDWKFVIAASVRTNDLSDFQKMQSAAAGYPISFIVNATNDDLSKIYNQTKIYWHASGFGEDLEVHPEKAEHFGISTVEAMSAGAVPIVINAGGQKEIVKNKENGLLWDTREELISQTTTVINDQKQLHKYSEAALHSAAKFSKETFNEKILSLVTK
ncbi:MAG TPA: glycosyltransferase family 4 protein [Candidatus Woesebacteria bacterium]|nr:glycosyltransferase family 4 protein [Candidatus Woesebacteria bacterium]